MEQVKSVDGAGEVLMVAGVAMEFQAIRQQAKIVLDEMLDALLDVFLPLESSRCRSKFRLAGW
jgi:hypothetical protein